MDNVENIEQKFNEKKKGKKGLIACILIVVILIAAACAYFIVNSKPKAILKSFVNKVAIDNKSEINEIKTVSTNFDLSANINTDDKQSQAMFDEISKCRLEAGAQLDINNTKEIINLGLKYSNQDVIDAQLMYDGNDIYAYLDGIFDKYIKLNAQKEQVEELNKVFDSMKEQYSNLKLEDSKEVVKILRNTLNEEIDKTEDVEQEKLTIKIGDKEKKVKKTTIKLTIEELKNLISKIYSNLSEAAIFSDKEKADLKEAANELEKLNNLNKDEFSFIISVYTKGINNKFVGANFSTHVKQQDMNVSIEILKKDKNSYIYSLSGNGQGANANIATGEISIEEEIDNEEEAKGRVNITAEIPAIVTQSSKITAEFSIGYDVKVNPTINTIDTSNSVDIDKLTQEDYETIMEKLEQRPLIGDVISMLTSTSIFNGTESLDGDELSLQEQEALENYYNNFNF